MPSPQQLYDRALSPLQKQALVHAAASAWQAAPAGWVAWHCGSVHLGHVPHERAAWLCRALSDAQLIDGRLVWSASEWNAEQRSAQLQTALDNARQSGLLTGWRNERFSFWAGAQSTASDANTVAVRSAYLPKPDTPHFFSVERSGFRFLGMMSHAVHINGFTPEGHLWCGRRALSKATDPGMLDNITAGGLPTGESALECALRELEEEAGITGLGPQWLEYAGTIRTARLEPQGYHDELLQVFNVTVPAHRAPANRDGEVSEFLCLSPHEVMERIARAEFTADAVASLALGLMGLSRY